MYKRNNKHGFTMAEMLIVVAIIGVLSAVSFVAVTQHQRSMERLERDSVAREIFIAAQNHLTMGHSQGYLGLTGETIYGNVENASEGIYYFVVNRGNGYSSNATPQTLLDLMLPFGSLDETVRAGGNYIIRYHPESATVMDVFYCSSDSRYGYSFNDGDLSDLVQNYRDGKESARKNYNGKILGWYGGATAETLSRVEVYAPLIVVENADKLQVGIKNGTGEDGAINPDTSSLQVIVTGKLSKNQIVFTLKSHDPSLVSRSDRIKEDTVTINGVECDYTVVLDDITTPEMHFADLSGFIPGEDITIQAVAFDNTQISTVAYGAEITVNSLYEKLTVDTGLQTMTASVSSIRHLENLDKRISNVTDSRSVGEGEGVVTCTLMKAMQTSDLDWVRFKGNTNAASTTIQLYETEAGATEPNCYLPVVPTYSLSYDGQNHSISDIMVKYAGDTGMFGTITGLEVATDPTRIVNLSLIDFSITQSEGAEDTTNAGTLAGTLKNVNVENVIAFSSKSACGVTAKKGNAGGLIGTTENCNITKSAASLYVTSEKGNAGGLIGNTVGGKISACYSGGHTYDGTYYNEGTAIYNITATEGNAGGLIGTAEATPIEYSYSTCSVTGEAAGGFVAISSGTGSSISHCYATGLVHGTGEDDVAGVKVATDGAFAYSIPNGAGGVSECNYFDIINERPDASLGFTYLTALGKGESNTAITPFDADTVVESDLSTYNSFNKPADWKPASAFDASLVEYYQGNYALRTVAQLGATVEDTDFVTTHYGDWPAPEIFVFNTAS